MNKSDADDWKTPLGIYERAIREITKAREDIQVELENFKAVQTSELGFLKSENKSLKEQLGLTKKRLEMAEKNAENTQKEIEVLTEKIKNKNLIIQHGVWEGTAKYTPGWSILEGNGNRVFRTYIRFSPSFSASPKVVVGLSYLDIFKNANTRLTAKVAEVNPNGFYLNLITWGDSKIWAAGVNWIAYGY